MGLEAGLVTVFFILGFLAGILVYAAADGQFKK